MMRPVRCALAALTLCALVGAAAPGLAELLYAIDSTSDELVLIQSATGDVFPIGPLDFDAADADLTRVGDSLYVLNSFFDVRVDLVELDRRTGTTLSSVPVTSGGVPIGSAEGLTQVAGRLVIGFDSDATPDAFSESIGDLALDGTISGAETGPSTTDFDGLGSNAATGEIYGVDVFNLAPLETSIFTVTREPFTTDTFVPSTPHQLGDVEAISNALFGLDIGGATIVEVDLATSAVTSTPLAGAGTLRGLAVADNGPVGTGSCRFSDSAQTVSMAAEDATDSDNSGEWDWVLRTSGFENAIGGAYLQALPNLNEGQSTAEVLDPPYLDYAFHLENTGTYRLFLRFDAPAAGPPPDDVPSGSDSLYASILGQPDFYRFAKQLVDPLDPPPTDRAGSLDGDFATDPWQGDALLNSDSPFANPDPAEWTLPAGNHVLRITLREDGVGLDQLVLQEASVTAPTGEGPGASAIGCCGDATTDPGEECDDGNLVDGDGCSAACLVENGAGICGDGIVDEGEQCDDGNTTPGDGCDALCRDEGAELVCAPAPIEGCLTAAKASVSISEKKAGKEKWKAKLKGFDGATAQSDLGDPLTGDTRYDLCLYDGAGQLAAELSVDRAGQSCGPKQKPCFKDKGGKDWLYKDPAAEASGTKKLMLGSGPVGKGKATWQAGNKAKKGQTALPTGTAANLAGATSATLQLVTSDAACFEAGLGTIKKADAAIFKGKAP